MIKVMICDDQAVVREGLKAILSTSKELEVTGVAGDGAEIVEMVSKNPPDVVLMDLKMPEINGIQATRTIRDRFPQVKVLVLTTYDADEWVFDAIRSGAAGYLLKDTPRDGLIAAIEGTAAGKTHIDPAVAGKLFAQVSQSGPSPASLITEMLNEREVDVLRLLARGFTNADIAMRLSLSEGTVRNYVSSVLEKLGVADRTQAAILALRHGIADQDTG
jgi:DNA-binding NarL/FixJ family response regulator